MPERNLTVEEVERDIEDNTKPPQYKETEVDPDNMLYNNAGLDALNKPLGTKSNSGKEVGDPYGERGLKVLGMPLFYSPLDDPNGRSYGNTFETDLPLIFIQPGRPLINRKLFGSSAEGAVFNLPSGVSKVGNGIANAAEYIATGKTSWRDSRWMSFQPRLEEFMGYLDALLENVRGGMGLTGETKSSSFINTGSPSFGLAFYMTKGSDVNESVNNEYSTPEVARDANDKQADLREKRMLAQVGGGSLADKASYWMGELTKQAAEIPVIGPFIGALTENLDGSMLYYPDVWNNSTFDRIYTLEFKFYSPYGDARSIFNYVYIPFLTLLTTALPLQDSYYSYKQPFIMRLSAPGHFECEMGIVRSMSIERGGDNKWSSEQLPREITVRMNVADMYPNLILSDINTRMQYNYGLLSYIDCLAGIRYDQLAWVAEGKREINISGERTSSLLSFKASGNHKEIKALLARTDTDNRV